MAYLLDANVFMAAKNLHYGMDFCPAFWDWLVREHQAGKVFSIEKVGDELMGGDDELARWALAQPNDFFLKPGSAAVTALGTVPPGSMRTRLIARPPKIPSSKPRTIT